jgi:shikimate dehydrogenase
MEGNLAYHFCHGCCLLSERNKKKKPTMKLFAVTGDPILHSKSPDIFGAVFTKNGIDAAYFRLAADTAGEAVVLMKALELTGLNVTAPYKADVIPFLDETDADADKTQAVNTIVNDNGRLKGYNTDHIGVIESFRDNNIEVKNKACVVIGAGGAGRAALYGIHKAGADCTVIDIDEKLAERVARESGCNAAKYDQLESCVISSDIVVYAVDASTINILKEETIRPDQVIYDVNYKQSFLTELAGKKGCRMVTGADMLINQAVPAYKYFLGSDPDKKLMWEGFNTKPLGNKVRTIALVGFMATGKTSVGAALAQKFGYEFIELDDLIVKTTGMTIADMFRIKGEPAFRTIEKDILNQEINRTNVVVSCGGGVVIYPENRRILKEHALTIWLYNSIETSVKRGNDGTRPLLNVDNPVQKTRSFFNNRKGYYADSADLMVNTENKQVEAIVHKIYAEISKAFGH